MMLFWYPELRQTLSSLTYAAWSIGADIAAYPITWLGYIFGFLISALIFIFASALILLISMAIFSQFGHILIDSLFDARNVRRSARAAGRFLVGIGFLASTIILCLPGNKLAQKGAAQAYVTASDILGGDARNNEGLNFVVEVGSIYLMAIPDEVEPAIVKGFSYGYPPSLELILVSIACLIAFFLILKQLASIDKGDRLALAFLPIELFFLLVGAVLVIMLALAAAADAEG
jgi:hypothetical protein